MNQHWLQMTITRTFNLQCTCCRPAIKPGWVLSEAAAERAIESATSRLIAGGTLGLAFKGGEPLLEVDLIEHIVSFARGRCREAGLDLELQLTTNGTIAHPRAWSIMTAPEMSLTVCCDGLPAVHDRHRRFIGGAQGTCATVLATIRRLLDAKRSFRVVMVVRPDTVDLLAESVEFLCGQGVRELNPALAVPPFWSEADLHRLHLALDACHDLWPQRLVIGSDLVSGTPVDVPCGSGTAADLTTGRDRCSAFALA